ncbi:MAG: hypothetical protein PHV37_01935 [Candidatus Gastranaerophilales bacterium]|nr:hypothetical protein [Candidatus Gastranaerophilales bacterium]
MNMTPYIKKKNNKQSTKKTRKVKKLNQVAYIQFELKKRGLSQVLIANELGMSQTAVCRAISGKSTIARVEEWLQDNIGLEKLYA